MIYALCCWGENERIILRLSSSDKECNKLKNEIKENAKKNGLRFYPEDYWIEKIDTSKKGILWECD